MVPPTARVDCGFVVFIPTNPDAVVAIIVPPVPTFNQVVVVTPEVLIFVLEILVIFPVV